MHRSTITTTIAGELVKQLTMSNELQLLDRQLFMLAPLIYMSHDDYSIHTKNLASIKSFLIHVASYMAHVAS